MILGEQVGIDLCIRKVYKLFTFYKCLRNDGDISPKWRHPKPSLELDQNLIEKAIDLIGSNPILTLDEIISYMVKEHNAPTIYPSTLSFYLEFSLITYKTVIYNHAARNSEKNKVAKNFVWRVLFEK